MTVTQIDYFMKVAELKSFVKAADALFVSRTAISTQISLLEDELQVTLFERRKRVITLTQAGEMYYSYFTECAEIFKMVHRNALVVNRNLKNEIRIGILDGYANREMTEAISKFQEMNPELQMVIEYHPFNELAHDVMDSEYDLVLTHRISMAESSQLCYEELYKTHLNVVLAESHPMAHKENLCIEDLDGSKLFLRDSITGYNALNIVNNIFKPRGMKRMNYTVMPNAQSTLYSVKLGFGIAVLDDDVITLADLDDTIRLPIDELEIDVVLVWRRDNTNPYREGLIRQIKEAMKK